MNSQIAVSNSVTFQDTPHRIRRLVILANQGSIGLIRGGEVSVKWRWGR